VPIPIPILTVSVSFLFLILEEANKEILLNCSLKSML
jgi:hypothetical protein